MPAPSPQIDTMRLAALQSELALFPASGSRPAGDQVHNFLVGAFKLGAKIFDREDAK